LANRKILGFVAQRFLLGKATRDFGRAFSSGEACCFAVCTSRRFFRVLSLLNGLSGFAGYVLMRSPFRPDFIHAWQQAILFFLLTMCVESRVLLGLLTAHPASVSRKLFVGRLSMF